MNLGAAFPVAKRIVETLKEEKEVYDALGMKWMEPELREDRGEIEASQEGWIEPPDLLNTMDLNKLMKWCQRK